MFEVFSGVCAVYCLMTNCYPLVIETPDGNRARGMRQLNGRYTQSSNQSYHRGGHLFRGRYPAILVDQDAYLPVGKCKAQGQRQP